MDKIINCKVCGLNNEETTFQAHRYTCIKCNSKKCNEKMGKAYFNEKVKARYVKHGQVGRPKKNNIEINL